MNCDECNAPIRESNGGIILKSKMLGDVFIPNILHRRCTQCGAFSLSAASAKQAADFISQKEAHAISRLPIGDFVSLNEAADILGVSKQAFNKNHRIKRGFIYQTNSSGKIRYYKPSVLAFKNTGDGRVDVKAILNISDLPRNIDTIIRIANSNNEHLAALVGAQAASTVAPKTLDVRRSVPGLALVK